jgi:hypothetical protein
VGEAVLRKIGAKKNGWWWKGVFAGVFEKKRVHNVVFLWSICGVLRGERGRFEDLFPGLKNVTGF